MKLFIDEYGKILLTVLLSVALLGSVFTGFVKKWRQFGGVEDSIKTDFESDEEKRTPPVLIARDVKIHSGEAMNAADYVRATDFDGSDISQQIQMDCVEKTEGMIRYTLTVTSPVTGKCVGGKLVILTDCPAEEGGVPACG